MSEYEPHIGETYSGDTVILDGGHWDQCTFVDCDVIFAGVKSVFMGSNKFSRCVFSGDFPPGWRAAIGKTSDGRSIVIHELGAKHLN